MSSTSLAQLSNVFVYSSMLVYTGSFITFAVSLASTQAREDVNVDLTEKVAVAASGSGEPAKPSRRVTGVPVERKPDALPPGRRAGNIAMALMWLATILLAAGVIARGISAGRAPWGNMYEFSTASALAISAVFLGISVKKDVRWLGVFISGAVLLTLGLAVTVLYTDSEQLVPALRSYWLAIHVTAAIISGGAFTFGAFVTMLYLVRDRAEEKAGEGQPVKGWLASRVPSADRLDALAYRTFAFVFPLWTFAIIAGAIWADYAWGRYWGWDPKETWAFITWVIFAGYLHARATAGWRGRRAAVIALIGFASFVVNYFVINLVTSGLHSYAGVS